MPGGRLTRYLVAGLAGTAAHLVLMYLKDRFGLLPQFQPYQEFQRGVSMLTGGEAPVWLAWLLGFLNGAVVWSFVFGRLYRVMPGRTPLRKGLFFGLVAWTISGLVFFPAMGRGPFDLALGLGLAPAALMLGMLCVYSLTLSFAYAALAGRDAARP
ncbi:MAG: hypothetical protein KGM42_02060 [Hyphomicrobiales bacterium]|nr:hypothetical protein [Hyphomicrobiales bacterium]